jgi:hypothetical protein
VNLREECLKISYCKFQSVDNDQNVPSCYIDVSKLKATVKENGETELGFFYSVELNNERATQTIRIDFEFLDDNSLRFKVKQRGIFIH